MVAMYAGSAKVRVQYLIEDLFGGGTKVELHHRPGLLNRRRKPNGDYDPPANDPNYLIYLLEDEHDIETRVRGIGAQLSDLGQARKRKRMERNRDKKRRKAKIPQRARPWPKTKFRGW